MTEAFAMPEVIITAMTSNAFVKFDSNGYVYARIDPPTNVASVGTGSLYLNGTKVTITSHSFVRIFPAA